MMRGGGGKTDRFGGGVYAATAALRSIPANTQKTTCRPTIHADFPIS
jgi:hypothetical protein